MSTPLPTVLFVDDEERIVRSLRMLFRGRCEVLATTSGEEAVRWVRERRVHVIVSDQRMPGMDGVSVLRAVARHSPATMRILLTGYADMDAVTASVNDGEIFRFIEKPWDAQQLIGVVNQAAAIAMREFAAPARAAAPVDLEKSAARVLVLDGDGDGSIALQVRDLLPRAITVHEATSLEAALDILADEDIAVMIAELTSAGGDVAASLKELKRLRPSLLAIVISPLRDSRVVIGLINEGQIFRFLLRPPVKELLRRGLIAALERHAEMRSVVELQHRHLVEAPREAHASLSGRLAQVWQRLRNSTRGRVARTG
ncbi:MAG TPA: response regulator [Rhodanobacteraceae bacterium]|nr:response regulator [Rhodanobacteraceae bacterium]